MRGQVRPCSTAALFTGSYIYDLYRELKANCAKQSVMGGKSARAYSSPS